MSPSGCHVLASRGSSHRLVVLQVMLDTEGIDAYDQVPLGSSPVSPLSTPVTHNMLTLMVPDLQTGQYSTQIFSLAVLLSSLFVYNQMGGIDEAALDRLSLVTEMTKHIRVKSGDSAGSQHPLAPPCYLAAESQGVCNFTQAHVWLQGWNSWLNSRRLSCGCCETSTSLWKKTATRSAALP